MMVMSDLKDRLRADLTAAIKARDEVRSSTLRMVLTAVSNAEVAGKEARELSDDDNDDRKVLHAVVRVIGAPARGSIVPLLVPSSALSTAITSVNAKMKPYDSLPLRNFIWMKATRARMRKRMTAMADP